MGFGVVAAVAVLYLPLAVNYTWPLFFPAPRLQDSVNTLVNGHAYAVGPGSVEAVRHVDYSHHRMVMLIHTTLGALALSLAMFQFSARLRNRHPAVHRWTGRTYLVLMSISMLTALVFLAATTPVTHFIGGAFDLQLWTLALGTLASAWYALVAIRRGDVISHRAWMGYSIALMMTAPLLRVLWIGVQPLVPQPELLDNLGAAAVLLGVAAPFGAAVAFLLTHQRSSTTAAVRPGAPTVYAGLLAVAIAGSIGYGALFSRLPAEVPPVFVWFHLLPLWLAIGVTLVGVGKSRVRNTPVLEQRWRWMLAGVAAAPIAACITALVAAPVYGTINGFIAGGMVGAPGPITIAFAVAVWSAKPASQSMKSPSLQPVSA
ncbi:hypothetical protein A5784_22315 [Mycobacterium sp. 852013-50091_SCH5140682]|nr:hypothetical protein A5784_22315 [Mycobacterium sp. 852013-50091_SCH5140682]